MIPIFSLKPRMLSRNERVLPRLNTLERANIIVNANIKDRKPEIVKIYENSNTLEVIKQKLVKECCKVEKSINPIDGQQKQQQKATEVSCGGLKNIFIEHDEMATDVKSTTDTTVKKEQGFISSHLKSTVNSIDGGDDDSEPTTTNRINEALITEDIFNDWINSIPPRDYNQLDRGIFPQTPSLSRSSKRIRKFQPNTSHFLE